MWTFVVVLQCNPISPLCCLMGLASSYYQWYIPEYPSYLLKNGIYKETKGSIESVIKEVRIWEETFCSDIIQI